MPFQVIDHMRPGGQEIRQEFHFGRPETHARFTAGRNIRSDQFQIGRLDDGVEALRTEDLGQAHEVVIGLGSAAAMSNEEDSGWHCVLLHFRQSLGTSLDYPAATTGSDTSV